MRLQLIYSAINNINMDKIESIQTRVLTLTDPDDIRMWKIIEIRQKYQYRYRQLVAEVGERLPDATILAFEDRNTRLILNRFLECRCRRFANLKTAIDNTREGEIIINVTDIEMYGVFTVENYYNFISNIHDNAIDDIITYNPQQIILTGWNQKIVFLCKSDEKIIERVRGYVKKCFGEDITVTRQGDETTISVNKPLMKDFEESSANFQKLVNMIAGTIGNNELTQLDLRQKQVVNAGGIAYQSYALSNNYPANVSELLKELHSVRAINFIVQINGNNNNNNNFHIGLINNVNNVATIEARAGEWIRLNPPTPGETSTKYYERYVGAAGSDISIINFGRLVKNQGYKTKKSGGCMRWFRE